MLTLFAFTCDFIIGKVITVDNINLSLRNNSHHEEFLELYEVFRDRRAVWLTVCRMS
jgi:hypothetical protein